MGVAAGTLRRGGQGGSPHATELLLTLGNAHENAAKDPKAELRLQPQEHSTVPGAAADGGTPRGDPASPRGWPEAFCVCLDAPRALRAHPAQRGPGTAPLTRGSPGVVPIVSWGCERSPPPAWQCHGRSPPGAAAPQHPLGRLKAVIKPSPRQIPP